MTEDRKYIIWLSSESVGTKDYLDCFVSDIDEVGDTVSGSTLLDQALLFTWERANEIAYSEFFSRVVALLNSRMSVSFFPVVVSVDFYKLWRRTMTEKSQESVQEMADLARKVEEADENTINGQCKRLRKAWYDFLLKMFPFLPHLTPIMLAHIVLLSCALIGIILSITSAQWWIAVGNGLLIVNSLINLYVERKYHKK